MATAPLQNTTAGSKCDKLLSNIIDKMLPNGAKYLSRSPYFILLLLLQMFGHDTDQGVESSAKLWQRGCVCGKSDKFDRIAKRYQEKILCPVKV